LRFQVGDLVKAKGENVIGIVVKIDKANCESLSSSQHSSSLVKNAFDVYYVFSNSVNGPYFTSELTGA